MKLLVTGGLGFIGSNFIHTVLNKSKKITITNIDAELFGSNHLNLKDISKNKNYNFVKSNINNKKILDKLIPKNDVIINFAAESFVDRSISKVKPFFDSNVSGVLNLLELCKNHHKRLIQISTDEVFGSLKSGTANENYPYNPSSPYATTKTCSELLAQSFHKTYDSDIVISRCTNNFGPRQFPEKLIPKVILMAEQNLQIPIYGNGKNIRDWLYVTDHCEAIFSLIEKGISGNSYNISGNNEFDNISIIKKILKKMNKSYELMKFVEDRPGHDFRYSMNSKKIRNKLNWKPKINFEAGLDLTIDWYTKNSEWKKTISKSIFKDTPWKK